MEYMKVVFPDARGVMIDGKPNGTTNVVIEIEAGTYTVSLSAPPDCNPARCQVVLKLNETGPLSPREVPFAKV